MPRFKIAHVREQGEDMIIVPLDDAFEHRSSAEQQQTIQSLQERARAAGLAGTIVPVWDRSGQMRFIAPPRWHPFFQSLSLAFVYSAINRELYW